MEVTLTTIIKARELLNNSINFPKKKIEKVKINTAIDRISAKNIKSKFNLPQTKNSAVDGYAISYYDIKNNLTQKYQVVGIAKAGHPFSKKITKNQAIEIYTGAIMPKGLDCVVMHENTKKIGKDISIIRRGIYIISIYIYLIGM